MIDNFEPYFEKIAAIHDELFTVLKKMPFVKKETQMFCLQCNYTEYVNEDHDKGYAWYKFCFDNDSSKVFALGINVRRFENKNAEMELIKKTVQNLWPKNCKCTVELCGEIDDVAALKREPYDMVVSVHYWFNDSLIDDGINDSQYLKIVYIGNGIEDKLTK